jgi:signal transduction histidine kinase
MMIFRVIHALTFAVSIGLGILVFLQNQRRTANQSFLVLTGALSLWLTFMMLAFQSSSADMSAFYVRATNSAAVFVPYIFDCLRLAVMQPERSFRKVFLHNPVWLFTCISIAVMCQTPFFLKGAEMPANPLLDVPVPIYGPGIIVYGVYFLSTLLLLVSRYYRDIREAEGIRKTELQFIMLSWATGTVVGVTFSIVIPVLTGLPQSVQFLPITALFILGIIAYGIATRRIMAVADVLRRLTAYALLTVYLIAVYAFLWTVFQWAFEPLVVDPFFPHLLAALVVAFSMAPAHGMLQQFANKLFVSVETVDVTAALQKVNRIINSITTREELMEQFAALVASSVGTDRVQILLAEGDVLAQAHPRPRAEPRARMELQNPLARTLVDSAAPLATDMLQRFRATAEEVQAGHVITSLGAVLAVGVHAKEGLKGIVLLGPRLSGRIYGATEQRALQVLCNQLAVGLDNADLYTQVKDSAIYNDILLDSIVSGIIAANKEGRVSVCNREALRTLRLHPEDVLHQPIEKLPPALAQALRTTLETGSGLRNIETRMAVPGVDDMPVRYSTARFNSHTGKQLGALLVLEDLTAFKKLESQVRRTDRLASIGTLSAGMAHEIKNPLVTLKTFTQLLPERYQDADFRDTFSSLVGQEVKRIDSIVNQLLRFARPAKPSLHPMHVNEVLDNTLRLVHQQLKQKNIQLAREYLAPSDLILGDNDLLVQAFLNFFLNAIDSMDAGGTLTVRTEHIELETNQITLDGRLATETTLRIAIRDTGHGIKPEDIPHVFDPFFTTKTSGTGLGLSVSHGIISEHKGMIDVESEVEKGATFYLFFPVAKREALV